MRKLKVANLNYIAALPFKTLEGMPNICYEENSPTENARKLHEGEVDLALISVVEYANHGGYVGLDFGIAAVDKLDAVSLLSNHEIKDLTTIYLYEGSSASAVMLKLLLAEKYLTTPRLVRVNSRNIVESLKPYEGVLVIHEVEPIVKEKFKVCEDLGRIWYEFTGLPFVYLVWAMRPGTLSMDQHRKLNDLFHRSVCVREIIADEFDSELGHETGAASAYVGQTIHHYLDDTLLGGLDEFFKRSASLNLLPQTLYRSATFTLLNRKASPNVQHKPVQSLFTEVIKGRRLSIREAVRIAEEATMSDLALATQMVTPAQVNKSHFNMVLPLNAAQLQDDQLLWERLFQAEVKGVDHILINPGGTLHASLSWWEERLATIKKRFNFLIEGFTVSELLMLSKLSKMSVGTLAAKLKLAGLDLISGTGGGMLFDRIAAKHCNSQISAAEWIDTIRWVHSVGVKSSCCLTISKFESWEERLIHLQKLRSLQDENPGFKYFGVQISEQWPGPVVSEIKLRTLMLARLFLDNVPTFIEYDYTHGLFAATAGLSFGANQLRIDPTLPNSKSIFAAVDVMPGLELVG